VTLDVGPVHVFGATRAHRGRVVWHEGTLHVVHTLNRIERLTTSEPVKRGDTWVTTTEDGHRISFTRRGCSGCGWRLGSLSLESIIEP
jgi:hypothetical protein